MIPLPNTLENKMVIKDHRENISTEEKYGQQSRARDMQYETRPDETAN